jgi:polar amino acid transport system permease protein
VSEIRPYIPTLLEGALLTAEITALAAVLGIALSFVGAFGRMSSHSPLRWLAGAYIEIFRGTSALVQLFWLFFVLPLFGVELSPFLVGVLALGLNLGAYGAEVVRGAITGVPRTQVEAAIALNLTSAQRVRLVVLPQAVGVMLPAFGNLLIELLKATSLVSLITLSDLTFRADIIRASTGETASIFLVVLLVYFAMSGVIIALVRLGERRVNRWRRSGAIVQAQAAWTLHRPA